MEDFIVADAESYIAQSLKLATDKEYRATMLAKLTERTPLLFEDAGSVAGYEGYFASAK